VIGHGEQRLAHRAQQQPGDKQREDGGGASPQWRGGATQARQEVEADAQDHQTGPAEHLDVAVRGGGGRPPQAEGRVRGLRQEQGAAEAESRRER